MSASSIVASVLPPDIDAEQATRHLELLHRGANRESFISLVLLGNKRRERHSFTRVGDLVRIGGNDAAESRSFLADVVNDRWNLYTACATFDHVPEKGRGTREDIDSLPGVWADLDVKPGTEDYFQTEDELIEFVKHLPQPTLEIASGSGGRHLYWLAHERMTLDEGIKILPDWLDFLRSESDGMIIENVMDSARILRLAGTTRWPKINDQQASTPRPVRIIKDSGPRYHAAELKLLSQYAASEAQTLRDEQQAARKKRDEDRRADMAKRGIDLEGVDIWIRRYNLYEDWEDLLLPDDWTLFSDQREGTAQCRYWVRPGKSIRDGKSASTDYWTGTGYSTTMTIYSHDPSLRPLWENAGTSDAHGLCSKFHYALTMRFDNDAIALIKSIITRWKAGEFRG